MSEKIEKIKLVIWDLDETFWQGTLSEEGVIPNWDHVNLVRELTNRGIINSIASKNHVEPAREKLVELGVWEFFIFPSINWNPKGQQVKQIIEDCQLRAPNVLFIDDNHMNLEEVRFYNPGIHAVTPDFIPEIFTHPAFAGKDDHEHSRLKQYKILEAKKTIRKQYSDNLEFLRSSKIQIRFLHDLEPHQKRIHELIERTNQLNYTKIRLSPEEVARLISDKRFIQGAIQVQDRFGDYGIVGYYCLDTDHHRLLHFVFSCRIINLGVEQFVYAHLNFPDLKINGDVASSLTKNKKPDWIDIVEDISVPEQTESASPQIKLFFKGGCDLSQMMYYLRGYSFKLIEETNYVGKNNFPIHNEHTELIVSIHKKDHWSTLNQLVEISPFFDENTLKTAMFDSQNDVYLYSLLMDYTQDLYRHKKSGICLPFGGYREKLIDKGQHEAIIGKFADRGITGMSAEFLSFFSKEFDYIGQIDAERFKANLIYIRSQIPRQKPIIFMNGAEIDKPEFSENGALERHRYMNEVLESIVSELPNTYVFDIRPIVNSPDKLTDNIRHYTRQTYNELASGLLKFLRQELKIVSSRNRAKEVFLKIIKHPTLKNNRFSRRMKK